MCERERERGGIKEERQKRLQGEKGRRRWEDIRSILYTHTHTHTERERERERERGRKRERFY